MLQKAATEKMPTYSNNSHSNRNGAGIEAAIDETPSRRRNAFTLLETLVVLAIVAMAATVSTVLLTQQRDQLSAKAASRDILALIREARETALRTRGQARFLMDTDQRLYWLESNSDGDDAKRALPDSVGLELFVAESERDGGVGGLRFFPDGSSTGGYIELQTGRRSYRIAADWLTGAVSVERHDAAE